MKKQHFTINADPYKQEILVCIGTSPRQTARLCRREMRKQPWWKHNDLGSAFTAQILADGAFTFCSGKVFFAPSPLLWLHKDADDAVIAHEVVHLAHDLLCARGVVISRDNDEPLAFLVEHLFRQISRKIKRRK